MTNLDDVIPLRFRSPGIRSNKKEGEVGWREWVPPMQKMQELKRRASHSQDEATIALGDGNSTIGLMNFCDLHMGAWSTDYDLLVSYTDQALAVQNLFIGLVGDYGHFAIKLRNVLEVSDNLLPPEQQTQFVESWFDEIWHKVAFASWENHGIERQEKQAGESSQKKIFAKKVVYFNGIGHVDLLVGKQLYKGAVSHAFRGRSIENPCHGQMRYMRREGIDREFAMAGDSHLPGLIKYTDGRQTRVAVNGGSIQVNSGFSKRYFSLYTNPMFPVIAFNPDKHEMTPLSTIQEFIDLTKQRKVPVETC